MHRIYWICFRVFISKKLSHFRFVPCHLRVAATTRIFLPFSSLGIGKKQTSFYSGLTFFFPKTYTQNLSMSNAPPEETPVKSFNALRSSVYLYKHSCDRTALENTLYRLPCTNPKQILSRMTAYDDKSIFLVRPSTPYMASLNTVSPSTFSRASCRADTHLDPASLLSFKLMYKLLVPFFLNLCFIKNKKRRRASERKHHTLAYRTQ